MANLTGVPVLLKTASLFYFRAFREFCARDLNLPNQIFGPIGLTLKFSEMARDAKYYSFLKNMIPKDDFKNMGEGKKCFFKYGRDFWTKFDFKLFFQTFCITLKRRNLEICEHSSLLSIMDEIVF